MIAAETKFTPAELASLKKLQPFWRADGSHDQLDTDLHRIDILQSQFNRAIGADLTGKDLLLSYNPVLARWKFEQLQTDEEKTAFRVHEFQQLETALRERYNVDKSEFSYSIDRDGKLRSEFMPDEPFEEVLKRGIAYRKSNGSQEIEREEQELVGFLKIQDIIGDKEMKLGTKLVLISPPGLVDDTPYTHNFVDIFELGEIDGRRTVNSVRFTSGISYEAYEKIVKKLEPDYFTGKDGPIDGWYLSHPILLDSSYHTKQADAVFDQFFIGDMLSLREEDFRLLRPLYTQNIDHYLDTITDVAFDGLEVALAFNTVYNKTDAMVQTLKQRKTEQTTSFWSEEVILFQDARLEAQHWGRKEVKTVSAGCGSSKGFSLDGESSDSSSSFSNSVAQFGKESHFGTCDTCKQSSSDNHYHCPNKSCNEKYADETNKSAGERTKQCKCGFKFGC